MTFVKFAPLPHRALIAVGGEDRAAFLHGLVSADILKLDPSQARYGAFLTAQGKFLHEFFVHAGDEHILLETERERRADFIKRLSIYKLRSKVTVAPFDAFDVFAGFGDEAALIGGLSGEPGAAQPFGGGIAFVDPRLAAAGSRFWLPAGGENTLAATGAALATTGEWDAARIALGLPDGSRDLEPEKALLLENGFDELHGVDWQKGCYLGQELTARTKYRALIKKRLMPVVIDGNPPAPGTPLMLDGVEAGEMRSSSGAIGLALVRLEPFERIAAEGGALTADGARLIPRKPDWAAF